MDPWAIPPDERLRHQQQFASLNPANGFVTGNQAKGFFMQSGLSPMVLAQIWGLADMNGDGQMDINEFSVACKMITMKLKGFELPSAVPPSVIMSLHPAAASQPGMPMMATSMGMMPQGMPGMAPSMPPMQAMPGMPAVSTAAMAMAQPHPAMAMPGMPGMPASSMAAPGMMVAAPAPVSMPAASVAASMAPPMSTLPVTSNVHLDWGIPQETRAKYSAVFAQMDKARSSGFIGGPDARNILVQSGLPQNILAQIWTLADYDGDGKLNTEEFILSGHLCDMAGKGEALPAALPPNLVPPSLRKGGMTQASDSVSTPGSVHGSAVSGSGALDSPSQAELEKRRQSLIEQQKKEEEARKKKEKEEAEERERQKKELERQRLLEWEKQRKEELTAHRQREQDKLLELKARQDNLKTDLEAMCEKVKTLTQDISDSRTGISDVKTFIDGMRSSRDTKMKEMSDLKARLKEQNQRLIDVTHEKAQLEAKNKARAAKIADGEADEANELTEFEMKKMEKEKEVVELREQFEEVKGKEGQAKEKYDGLKDILALHRADLEKIIEACKTMYDEFDDKRREIKAEKAKRIRELTDPDHAWGSEEVVAEPLHEPGAHHQATNGPGAAADGYVAHRALYDYASENESDLRFAAGDVIMVIDSQAGEEGWMAGELDGKVGWFPENYVQKIEDDAPPAEAEEAVAQPDAVVDEAAPEVAAVAAAEVAAPAETATASTTCPFPSGRILHGWRDMGNRVCVTRNDTVRVLCRRNDDWWIVKAGESIGYLPAIYVLPDSAEERGSTPVDAPPAPEEMEMPSMEDVYIALHPYVTEEAGDLAFQPGDVIVVTQKDGEWWTGEIPADARTGLFPYNYVEALEGSPFLQELLSAPAAPAAAEAAASTQQAPADAALEQAPVQGEATAAAAPAAQPEPEPSGRMSKSNTLKKSKKKKKKDDDKKAELAKVVASYDATSKEQLSLKEGQMIRIKKKTDSGWWQGEIQAGKGQERATGWFPAAYVKLLASKGGDQPKAEPKKYRAVYNFTGTNEDELSFSAGQVILLESKLEADWWKGECEGVKGVFPSTYVEPIE